jgi:hypothetical protein
MCSAVCSDVDECKSPGACYGDCKNTQGGYQCQCPPGFEGNASIPNGCKGNANQAIIVRASCKKKMSPLSLRNASCSCCIGERWVSLSTWFTLLFSFLITSSCSTTRSLFMVSVMMYCIFPDIDECAHRDTYPCYGICINMPGTFHCQCKSGTSGDPLTKGGCIATKIFPGDKH